ncbi:hypothetical protein LCM10_03925 [Rossellomorea aquimaris]|uniref:hypothetical protein n=1 Tax=Rossellomorea aquimaris TaxID=189382 RepID=UPI001CD4E0FE|nr:hypothetical protein [Rossellomorea aquimaris]MCA1054124.1 hypothetical protein [Rossellomorea aquimaris]
MSEEEFNQISIKGLNKPSRDDFRKLTFDLNIEHLENVVERGITFPDYETWKHSLDSIDGKKRYWVGRGTEQNNDGEKMVRYHREIIIYSNGLSNEEIQEAFQDIVVEVYLKREDGMPIEKTYRVGDFIQFSP